MRAIITTILISGCGIFAGEPTEESWPEDYAQVYCSYALSCETSQFWYRYDGSEDCRYEISENVEDAMSWCAFSLDDAIVCMDMLAHDSCKELGENFEQVWDACSNACTLDLWWD